MRCYTDKCVTGYETVDYRCCELAPYTVLSLLLPDWLDGKSQSEAKEKWK